jgi:RNA polymerase sigma-70 factor, ECF subfamily
LDASEAVPADGELESSDLELVRSAVAGDDRAFHALVDRHAPALFRSALSLSRNRADAEDLLQETLIAAHRGLKNFAGRSSVRTWLVTILTRKAFKVLNRAKRRPAVFSLDADENSPKRNEPRSSATGADSIAAIEGKLDVMQVLQTLGESHRQVLVLREIQGLSYDEIAAVLQMPRGTVESRIFRARAEFRQRYSRATSDK